MNKARAVEAIVAEMKPAKPSAEEETISSEAEGSDMDTDVGMEAAAEEAITAINTGNASDLAAAIRRMVQMAKG